MDISNCNFILNVQNPDNFLSMKNLTLGTISQLAAAGNHAEDDFSKPFISG